MQDVLYVVAAPLLCFWSFCSCEYPDMTASTCVHGLKSKPLWSLAFPKLKIKATAQNVVKQIEAVRRRLLQIGCDAAFATTRFSWNGAAIDFVIVCIFFPPCLNAGYIFRFVVAQLCRNKKKFVASLQDLDFTECHKPRVLLSKLEPLHFVASYCFVWFISKQKNVLYLCWTIALDKCWRPRLQSHPAWNRTIRMNGE